MLTAAILSALQSGDSAARLWRALPEAKGNVVVSPTSLEACLGLMIPGIGLASRPALARTLGVSPASLDEYGKTLQARLKTLTAGGETTVSNAGLFAAPPAPAYKAAVEKGYGARIDRLQGLAQVNAWVNGKTKGRIPSLLSALPANTAAVLLNAVTFDGEWAKAFSAAKTTKAPFAATSGNRSVPTMRATDGRLGYARGLGFRLVTLPYKGDRYRMVVMLPDAGDPGKLLGSGTWRKAATAADVVTVDLTLPRFTVRSEPPVEAALRTMGLAPLFASLDFRRAVPSGAVRNIGQVVQKTYVKVDEKGTEAAAATGIMMPTAMPVPQTPVIFHADRPFAFAIQHVASGEVLFEGVIREP